jgi:uncharacterized iron-regulated membrane protein
MSFRKVVFWLHLVAGVISGIAIGIMCLTGTALAFEKQIVVWAERDARQVPDVPTNPTRLTIDELDQRVRSAEPASRPASIIVSSDPRATVAYSLGRDDTVFANPYTGEVLRPASTATHDFLHVLVEWHRFLALAGEQRPIGKVINGVCNLAFCALAITGVYLWMPRTWSWRGVRAIALFNWRLTGKARDFNWHNVIGLWSAPILIVLTLTAVPISFRWGNALVYRLVGEVPPTPGAPAATASPAPEISRPAADTPTLPREAQFAVVQKEFPTWEQITLRLSSPARGGSATRQTPAASAPPTITAALPQPSTFVVKLPDAWPRTATTTVALNPYTGEILRREAFADLTTGRQVRTWTRFLHTGEAVGWIGQGIAGLASLGGCFLVYTGFALAWRRIFGKRPVES